MVMAKIVKAEGAPEGRYTVSTANGEFAVSDRGFQTDDPVQLEAAQADPNLVVEITAEDEKAAALSEEDILYAQGRNLEREQWIRDALAEAGVKDPADPADYIRSND